MESRVSVVLILGLCVLAGLVIAGCTQPSETVSTPTATVTPTAEQTAAPTAASTTMAAAGNASGLSGMANPASVNCGQIGGTTEIMTAPDGSQYGMCNFQNGTSCEEWALFLNEGCHTGEYLNASANATAGAASGQTGLANPASVNCVNIGGTVEIMDSPAGQYGMCTFANGTSCEEWALFRGEGCQAANVTA